MLEYKIKSIKFYKWRRRYPKYHIIFPSVKHIFSIKRKEERYFSQRQELSKGCEDRARQDKRKGCSNGDACTRDDAVTYVRSTLAACACVRPAVHVCALCHNVAKSSSRVCVCYWIGVNDLDVYAAATTTTLEFRYEAPGYAYTSPTEIRTRIIVIMIRYLSISESKNSFLYYYY